MRQQCRRSKGSGIPRARFPEGFLKSGPSNGSVTSVTRAVLWRALLRRLSCCLAVLAVDFPGKSQVRAQHGECPVPEAHR